MTALISEEHARRILSAAFDENRCAEFLECMWEGGSATVDARTGKLSLVSGEALRQMMGDSE